jgi:hypothetical protein
VPFGLDRGPCRMRLTGLVVPSRHSGEGEHLTSGWLGCVGRGVGLIGVLFVGALAARIMDGSDGAPLPAAKPPVLAPVAVPAPAGPVGELDAVVTFFVDNRANFRSARDACDQAFECSVIDPATPQTGAVARAADIPSCVATRLPVCDAAALRIEQSPPPAVIRDEWRGVLDLHVQSRRGEARVLSAMIAEGRRLRVPKNRTRPCVLDELPDGDKFERESMAASLLGMRGSESWDRLDGWLKKRGACAGAVLPNACGLATFVLGDDSRKVGARYAEQYRPAQSPAEKYIRSYLAQRYKPDPSRLRRVEVNKREERTQATIVVRAHDNLTVGLIRTGALLEARDIIRDLSSGTETSSVDAWDVSLLFDLKDAYQRDVETQVMRAKLTNADARRVNWSGVYAPQFERLLRDAGSLYVHPALGDGD